MDKQQQQLSHLDQRQHQPSHVQQQDCQQQRNKVQRREFLWRERVRLELQVQANMARAESLDQAWRVLQQRKVSMQQKKPKLAAQIVLTSFIRTRSFPAERRFQHERERLVQEEARLRQAMLFCQGDLAGLQAQIEVIRRELSFLA